MLLNNKAMFNKTNLLNQCEQLTDYWSPKIVGEVNDQYVKVAKLKGEFEWHKHDAEDELFYILRGELVIQYSDSQVELAEGDMHIVPKGVMHNPRADNDCLIALVESKTTAHTGDIVTAKTRSIEHQLGQP